MRVIIYMSAQVPRICGPQGHRARSPTARPLMNRPSRRVVAVARATLLAWRVLASAVRGRMRYGRILVTCGSPRWRTV